MAEITPGIRSSAQSGHKLVEWILCANTPSVRQAVARGASAFLDLGMFTLLFVLSCPVF